MGKTHIIGVGLDLGGTYTGTFITSHPSGEAEHRDHSSAFTVVNSEKLSFSSKSRTAVRPGPLIHGIRFKKKIIAFSCRISASPKEADISSGRTRKSPYRLVRLPQKKRLRPYRS